MLKALFDSSGIVFQTLRFKNKIMYWIYWFTSSSDDKFYSNRLFDFAMETFTNLNDVVFNSNCYFVIGGLFLSYLIYRIVHTLMCDNSFMQTRFRSRRHTWRSIQCNKSIPYNIDVSTPFCNYKTYLFIF